MKSFFMKVVLLAAMAVAAVLSPQVALASLVVGSAGLTVNRANMDDMFRGFNLLFNDAFIAAPSMWDKIAMQVQSTAAEEKYAWLGQMPGFREWLGSRVVNRIKEYDYTIKNKSFEATVEVKRDDIQDDRLGVYNPFFKGLGDAAARHPNELLFALLRAGTTNRCYDGQYFFDTSHPLEQPDGSFTTQSNNGGGAGTAWYLLETSRFVRPLILQKRQEYTLVRQDGDSDEPVFNRKVYVYGSDARIGVGYGLWQQAYRSAQTLDVDSYAAARTAMMSVKADRSLTPLAIMPDLLVVPPTLEKAAKYALEQDRMLNGASNVYVGSAKILVAPWLA